MTKRHAAVAALMLIAAGAAAAVVAQKRAVDDPGAALFRAHCASCHGTNAQGMGPIAERRHPMPDLTRFAARNGGVFPSERLRRIIDGRDVYAHGTPEMPVWGQVFQRRENLDDAVVRARIDSILKYLEGIQRRSG